MTIKSSGSLTFTEIEAEWDNASPFSLSEFYSGTSTVFSGAADGDGNVIPSSGAISFSDFYNTTFFNASSHTGQGASGPSAGSNHNGGSTSSTATVPAGANAILITSSVGGGGGGLRGSDHKDVGESPGDGGGSGGYIQSAFFTVTAGETITFVVGHGGNDNHVFWSYPGVTGNAPYTQLSNVSDGNGGTTSASGSSTGTLFTLTGGGGAVATDVGAFKSLRQDNPGAGGTVTLNATPLSSGTTTGAVSVTSADTSNGSAGADGAEVGENQGGVGGAGADSGAGSGGAGGTNNVKGANGGTGAGGGGGHSQSTGNPAGGTSSDGDHSASGASTFGGLGGHGQLNYQFVRVA